MKITQLDTFAARLQVLGKERSVVYTPMHAHRSGQSKATGEEEVLPSLIIQGISTSEVEQLLSVLDTTEAVGNKPKLSSVPANATPPVASSAPPAASTSAKPSAAKTAPPAAPAATPAQAAKSSPASQKLAAALNPTAPAASTTKNGKDATRLATPAPAATTPAPAPGKRKAAAAPPPEPEPTDDEEEEEDEEAEEGDEDEDINAEQQAALDELEAESEAATDGLPPEVLQQMQKATRIKDVLTPLIEVAGINTVQGLIDRCMQLKAVKNLVPVLERIPDVPERVTRAAEVLGVGAE